MSRFTGWVLLMILLALPFCSGGPNVRTSPGSTTGSQESHLKPGPSDLDPQSDSAGVIQSGVASWYGDPFHGRRTANGEVYDMYMLTAAHKTLPFHTIVEVQNLENYKKIIVRINDRGPFVSGRILDLSFKAAKLLDMIEPGTAPVNLRLIRPDDVTLRHTQYSESHEFYLQAGAFRVFENAKRMCETLKGLTGDLRFLILSRDGYHRVVSEKLASRDGAVKYKRILDRSGIDTFIKEVF